MGWDTALFVSPPPDYALCAVCHDVLREPRCCKLGQRCARAYRYPCARACALVAARSLLRARVCCVGRFRSAHLQHLHASFSRSFCKLCITKWLSEQATCPVDRSALTAAGLIPNLGLRAAVATLQLR